MSGEIDFFSRMSFWVPGDDPAGPSVLIEVVVHELSVAEIRKMLAGEAVVSSEPPTALDVALWGMDPLEPIDLSPADIFRFTNLTAEDAERLTMSQRRALVQRVREVNGDFFGLVEKWPGVVEELMRRMTPEPSPAPPSTTSSVPSQA